MVRYDIGQSTTTDLDNASLDYSVDLKTTDSINAAGDTYYDFPNSSQYLGYYKTIPELKKAIDALATWIMGKGYITDPSTEIILERVTGWGEDSINSIFWNLLVNKKIYGDAFAEIIRDEEGELLNLKVLDPAAMRVVVSSKGIIKRYELRSKQNKKAKTQRFGPHQILHLCNDRISDEIHGTSVIEACKWVIDARNEAMDTYRKILKRNLALGVLYIKSEDSSKIDTIMSKYKDAIKNGEVLVLPDDVAEIKDSGVTISDFISWIRYLENFFYQAVGIPKVILGGSEEFTEASSKVGYLTFEQIYNKEHVELEADLWNQIGIKITFNKPVSLKNELFNSESKNTSQVGIQPNETQVGMTRTE